jgi:hypothetical protein
VRSHPKLLLPFLTQLEVAEARLEHQTTGILFIFGFLPKGYFILLSLMLVLLLLGTVSLALPGDLICGLSSNRHAHDT